MSLELASLTVGLFERVAGHHGRKVVITSRGSENHAVLVGESYLNELEAAAKRLRHIESGNAMPASDFGAGGSPMELTILLPIYDAMQTHFRRRSWPRSADSPVDPKTPPLAVTDTHALVWAIDGNRKRLGRRARKLFDSADDAKCATYIPAFVLAELGEACHEGRVTLAIRRSRRRPGIACLWA